MAVAAALHDPFPSYRQDFLIRQMRSHQMLKGNIHQNHRSITSQHEQRPALVFIYNVVKRLGALVLELAIDNRISPFLSSAALV